STDGRPPFTAGSAERAKTTWLPAAWWRHSASLSVVETVPGVLPICRPLRSRSRVTVTSNHSPFSSETLFGLGMISLMTRAPGPGGSMLRAAPWSSQVVPPTGALHLALALPGEPLSPGSYSIVESHQTPELSSWSDAPSLGVL